MTQHWFKTLFAATGTKTAVPDAADPSGFISYDTGYGPDYQRVLGTDPLAKTIERDKLNQVLYDMTGAIQQYQTHAFPEFITTANNGGTPYAYDVDAIVRYDSGGGFNLYQNTTAANTNAPTGAGWVLKSGGLASVASPAFLGDVSINGVNVGVYPYRNRIINGAMNVNQINGTTAVTPTANGAYFTDMFNVALTQPSKLTFQQVVDAPSGFKYSTKVTVASQYTPLSTDYFMFQQRIEGQNITDFAFGTNGAVTLNTSNWIKGSVAGTYSVAIYNGSGRSYIGTINVTTSWAKVAITLVGDTTGTWTTDNTIGMFWTIDLGSGSNYNTTAGAWQNGNFLRTSASVTFVNQVAGSTLNITGVQLEKVPTGATQGTEYEWLSYDEELRRCQRYLPVISGNPATTVISHGGALISTVTAIANFKMPSNLRVPITGITLSSASHFTIYNGAINIPPSNMSVYSSTRDSVSLSATVSGATIGQSALVLTNNTLATIIFTGAQL